MSRATIDKPKQAAAKAKGPKKALVPRQFRSFRPALNYLNSLVNYERAARAKYNTTNFGTSRMSRILTALGNPQKSYKAVHIAGTKGKGSTATMLAAMLRACDLKVGLYTSPHLLNIRERIAVGGEMISESGFAKAISAAAAAATKARIASPTYFEILTAAAFHNFAEEKIELAVVETGLGGRLDATNVISPEVVGITSISYDHLAQLGTNLGDIAGEKAGIIKKGIPVICSPQPTSVRDRLIETAKAAEAPLRFSNEGVDFSYRFEFSRSAGRHARICLTTENSRFEHLQVPLLGAHQAVNCSLALGILDALKQRGIAIDDQKAMTGLADVELSGRMQMIRDDPRVLVDAAHNAASIDALVRAVGQHIAYDSMVMIFGCQRDKDIHGMIKQIQLGADKIIFTSTGSPRSAEPAELAAEYQEVSGKMTQVAATLDDAMQIAMGAISREDLICVTGSFYLVAEAIRKYSSTPPTI